MELVLLVTLGSVVRSLAHDVFCLFSLFPHLFSRAYLNFKNQDDVVLFRDRFDGYVFIDSRGEAIHYAQDTHSFSLSKFHLFWWFDCENNHLYSYKSSCTFKKIIEMISVCRCVIYLVCIFVIGQEYPAVVEFAPFQKIAKRRSKKKDAKIGTIEEGCLLRTSTVIIWWSHWVSISCMIFLTPLMHRWWLQEVLGVVQWRRWEADLYTRDSAWGDRG